MRWIVRLEQGKTTSLYLPHARDSLAFGLKVPVTISFAATFRTKKLAVAAVADAKRRRFPATYPVYEKHYRRSWAPGTRPT